MARCTPPAASSPVAALCRRFAQCGDLPFADLLDPPLIERALAEAGATWRERVFTPAVTLAAFLSQMLCPDGSCRKAVARVRAWLSAQGRRACSAATGGYCKARQRLTEGLLHGLVRHTGRGLERDTPAAWRWRGRPVKIADGTTASMPDTPELRAAYPPVRPAAAGGFPIARLVGLFALATGAALDLALGPWGGKHSGEGGLFRRLAAALDPGDVLLGDRIYSGFHDVARLLARGVDTVVRGNARRRCDFRRGRRLGRHDHLVTYPKPRRPDWVTAEEHEALPAALTVREVRITVAVRGFRTEVLWIATTLLDPAAYPAAELADLFRARWQIELDFRALKVTLHLDVLRCRTPDNVRREVFGHLLAYNLLCALRAQAAAAGRGAPRRLSFAAARQSWDAFADLLAGAGPDRYPALRAAVLEGILAHRVGDRPDRVEPRARKRRPKDYPLLREPRAAARAALCDKRCA